MAKSLIHLRTDANGGTEDHFLHHCIELHDERGRLKQKLYAHCGVKAGYFTHDVAELHSNKMGCPACRRFHREALEEEAKLHALKQRD
jgi:hypothetical protein